MEVRQAGGTLGTSEDGRTTRNAKWGVRKNQKEPKGAQNLRPTLALYLCVNCKNVLPFLKRTIPPGR